MASLSFGAVQERRRKILILHSYHQGLKWTDDITKGIQEIFKSYESKFELYYDYLDSKRNTGIDYMRDFYRLQKDKNQHVEFSILIICDNNALAFVVTHGKEIYGDIPMVFCGINNFTPEILGGLGNITGIVERTDLKGQLELIEKLHPDRKNIFIIVDRTPTGDAMFKSIQPFIPQFSDMNFRFYRDFLFPEIGPVIERLGDSNVIYLLTINRDRNDNFLSYTEGIEMIRRFSSAPIYGSWDFYLGKGIVGGILTRGIDQGRSAGKMAVAILNGRPASAIPIDYNGATLPVFDYPELKRFDLSSSLLPLNSRIINMPPTSLDLFSKYAVPLISFLIFVSLVMGARMFIIRSRANQLKETAELLEKKVKQRTRQLESEKLKLEETLTHVKTLQGLLPICASCKKIRDDGGYWRQIESYISKYTDASFSHGICPDCLRKLYPDMSSNQ